MLASPIEQTASECPSQNTLADFSSGRLGWPFLEGIALHAGACAKCGESLDALNQADGDDPFIRRLRRCFASMLGLQEPALATLRKAAIAARTELRTDNGP